MGFGRQCCCVPQSASCRDQPPQGRDDDDLVGAGLIDPRTKGISTRIVNRPSASVSAPIKSCPSNMRTCCYDSSNSNLDLSVFGRSCLTPDQANGICQPAWREGLWHTAVSASVHQSADRQQDQPRRV